MKTLLLILVLSIAAFGQGIVIGGQPGSGPPPPPTGVCGPPTYDCAPLTNNTTVVALTTVPSVGASTGAGTLAIDPVFGTQICRLTQYGEDPSVVSTNQYFNTGGGGSDDANTVNLDSSMVIVNRSGFTYPLTVAFTGGGCTVAHLYAGSFPSTAGIRLTCDVAGCTFWSRSNLNVLYAARTSGILEKWDFTNRVTPPTASTFFDFKAGANCLPANSYTYLSTGEDSAANDLSFGVLFSTNGQDGSGAIYVVSYTQGQGCSYLNTSTGVVKGDWGFTGTATLPSGLTTVHNVKVFKNGQWIFMQGTASTGNFAWNIGTSTIVKCATNCSGHWSPGFASWSNGGTGTGNIWTRLVANLATDPGTLVVSGGNIVNSAVSQHEVWNHTNSADTYPIFATFQFNNTTSTINFDSTLEFENEIVAELPASGSQKRFAHAFSTMNSLDFNVANFIGQESQDGNYFLFSSDWACSLGTDTGTTPAGVAERASGTLAVNANCGLEWLPSHAYSLNSLVTPYAHGNSTSTPHTFKVTTAGTTSSTQPSWCQTGSCTVSNGSAVFTENGLKNGIGAPFLMSLIHPGIISVSPTSAHVGDTITITGAGFAATQAAGSSVVTINGATTTCAGWSNTSLTCVVPSTTTGNLHIIVDSHQSNNISFTVL